MKRSKKIILCALFISATVILGRLLSIRTPIITIGFSFVPIILSAIILGPKYSTFIATMSDIIGALMFPTGSYFFGFTITSLLNGLTYGLILYRKKFKPDKKFIIRLIISTVITSIILNGCLNTIWVIMISSSASKVVIPIRILKQLIMIPIKVIVILSICRALERRLKELIND